MPLRRVTPIDALYDSVAGADLVIVPDVALGSAINRRLDRPQFGSFATTPRRYAARRREYSEERHAFQEVIKAIDPDWKDAAIAIEEIMQCWEHTGDPTEIRNYEGFDTDTVRRVLDHIESIDTTSLALATETIDTDIYPEVAVVGEPLLTPLQRSILPAEYRSIDLFTTDTQSLPSIHRFSSRSGLVESLVRSLTPERASEVAIVLDASGEYAPLLESALASHGIPTMGGPGFIDDPHVRSFLACLHAVFTGPDTPIGDVRPLLAALGGDLDRSHDAKRIDAVSDPALSILTEWQATWPGGTFGTALASFEERLGSTLPPLRSELDTLGLLEKSLSPERLTALQFYLTTYDVPIDRETTGVILADATSAAFVDRPQVFYIGLDDGFTHQIPRRPWVDRDVMYRRNRMQFELLLQSGTDRHAFVVDEVGGRPVQPTIYLQDIEPTGVETIADLGGTVHRPVQQTPGKGFDATSQSLDSTPRSRTSFSQSALNRFTKSPRAEVFGRLVSNSETLALVEGARFHEFAELVVAHPDVVLDATGEPDEAVLDTCADRLIDAVSPYLTDLDRSVKRTEYRAVFETIIRFVRTRVSDDVSSIPSLERSPWAENLFADHFDGDIETDRTERRFDIDTPSLHGDIDLLADTDWIVDFKRSSADSSTTLTKQAAIEPPADDPNFQPLVYLTALRSLTTDTSLTYSQFHYRESVDDAITGVPDVDSCRTDVTYRPVPYHEFIHSEACFEELRTEAPNDCNKTFEQISYATWLDIIEAHEIPITRDTDALLDTPFHEALTVRLESTVGTYKYVTTASRQACQYLIRLRQNGFFADDLAAFASFVTEQLVAYERYAQGDERFPAEGPAEAIDWTYVSARDMLLFDEATRGDQ